MIWVILIAAAVVVLGGGLALGVGLLKSSRSHLGDYARVVPGAGPEAPASWAGAHSPEAKLHRRIRDAVKAAHDRPVSGTSSLATLDDAAVALDHRLIGAAALPERHRAAAIAELAPLVDRFEDSIADYIRSSTPTAIDASFDSSMAAIHAELEALASAREEVERIDRSTGSS